MKKILFTIASAICTLTAMAQQQVPAFPGAEGHGRYVTGGRSSDGTTKVYHVTSLEDDKNGSIEGTLRWALKQSGPRTIVFDVAGVIPLVANLSIPDNTTIAGQTAPYPGITLRYYTIHGIGNNVIIRYIRSRRGQEKDVNDSADAIWERQKTGIILDHCSFSWSIDEVASFYDNNNFTMQWCTIAESLVNPGHSKGAHGYGGIWGGKLASFHHNLIAHVANRSPRFNGARYTWSGYTSNMLYDQYQWENYVQAEIVDLRNCVIYNCGNGCYGGPGGGYINIANNYYKTGPSKKTSYLTTVTVGASGNSTKGDLVGMTSRYYINGNILADQSGNPTTVSTKNWSGVSYDSGTKTKDGERYSKDPKHFYGSTVEYVDFDGTDYVKIKLDAPIATGEVTTHTAEQAFENVLAHAGASLYIDEVDARYFNEAKDGTTTYTGSVTKTGGLVDLVSDVNGYTEETFATGKRSADFDTDGDGMPDEWESANGLNPNDPSDANLFTIDTEKKWYSNLEVYLNSIVEDIMKEGNANAETAVDEYYPACVKTSTGIEAFNTTSAITSTEYYSLNGSRLCSPQKGVMIRVERMSNGKTIVSKVIK